MLNLYSKVYCCFKSILSLRFLYTTVKSIHKKQIPITVYTNQISLSQTHRHTNPLHDIPLFLRQKCICTIFKDQNPCLKSVLREHMKQFS